VHVECPGAVATMILDFADSVTFPPVASLAPVTFPPSLRSPRSRR
jgi:hypothetical protein